LFSQQGELKADDFEPDEPITSIKVPLHTVAVSDASTDSDISVELFDSVNRLPLGSVRKPG
jgi:hypothetical protein